MTRARNTEGSNQGGLSRRDFLERSAAVGAMAGIGAALPSGAGAAEAPRKGGLLRQALMGGSITDSLDPQLLANALIINVNYQLANALIEMSPELEPIPELAESWEALDKGLRWAFKLRRGVQFHNGKEMTSADVIYSLNRHRGPDSKSATAGEMKIVKDITADGPHGLTILLESPNVDMPYLLADIHLTIQPEGDPGDSGIGTGPYMLEEHEHGVRYLAKRNPNYFKPDRGWFDAVETLAINDNAARLTALQTGDVQVINQVEPRSVAFLKRSPNVEVVATKGRNFLYFPMRCDAPPFDNPDLRLALKYAVDREEMVRVILFGYGSVGNDHPISPAYPLAPTDIPQRPYDPAKAAELYKKSGHSGPVVLQVSDGAFPGAIDAAILYQRSAEKAGIQIDVQRVPADGYWESVWNVAPFCASTWSGRPTQDLMLSTAFLSDAPWNDSAWRRPEFDALVAQARSELDVERRRQLYREAVVMVHEDAGHLTPMFNDYIDAVSTKVKGFVPDPNFELSGYRLPERAWFAE